MAVSITASAFSRRTTTWPDGTLLHQTAYPQRAQRYREIQIEGIKIDFYDPQARVVHEIKRSTKMEAASVAQLQILPAGRWSATG